jgi:hypothetical protein
MPQEKDKAQPDDPRQAVESGEPGETGRSHGRIVDRDNPEGVTRPAPDDGKKSDEQSENWESGRQRSI